MLLWALPSDYRLPQSTSPPLSPSIQKKRRRSSMEPLDRGRRHRFNKSIPPHLPKDQGSVGGLSLAPEGVETCKLWPIKCVPLCKRMMIHL